jgi:hypothetical protein
MKEFTIYGERCSGTNYLEELILLNFEIDITWKYGWKHFFGAKYVDFSSENTDDILFIGIFRNPYDWLYSFYKNPHHLHKNMTQSLDTFLFYPIYSIVGDNPNSLEFKKLIDENDRFKNIFELRKTKNNYLINVMKNKVKNFMSIRYEDLLHNYENILTVIRDVYGLVQKHNTFKNVEYYKKEKFKKFVQKEEGFSDEIKDKISFYLEARQEKRIGYDIMNNENVDPYKNCKISNLVRMCKIIDPYIYLPRPNIEERVNASKNPIIIESTDNTKNVGTEEKIDTLTHAPIINLNINDSYKKYTPAIDNNNNKETLIDIKRKSNEKHLGSIIHPVRVKSNNKKNSIDTVLKSKPNIKDKQNRMKNPTLLYEVNNSVKYNNAEETGALVFSRLKVSPKIKTPTSNSSLIFNYGIGKHK